MTKITIDTDDILLAANAAGDFVFDGTTEEHLALLLDTQERLNKVIEQVKKNIETKGLEISPSFTGVRGDQIKVAYSAHGALYKIDDINKVPPTFYTQKVSYSIDTGAVTKFKEDSGKLPDGIVENARKKSVTITRINKSI